MYDTWLDCLGFPLVWLADADPESEHVYRDLFLQVSPAAPNYDELAAQEKWNDLSAPRSKRDAKRSWRSLRHFARQHGYVILFPNLAGEDY